MSLRCLLFFEIITDINIIIVIIITYIIIVVIISIIIVIQGATRNLPQRGVGYALAVAAESLQVQERTGSCSGRQLQRNAIKYRSELAVAAVGSCSGNR